MEAATTAAPAAAPQHMRALEQANRVRLARAALKRSVRAGNTAVEQVVRTCPWEAETMTVSELLRSQSRWGRTRTRKFLVPLAVSENRQLGRLTLRQKEALAGALEEKVAARR
jgi:hypothetical protein